MRNWAGNLVFNARRVVHPSTVEELRALVAEGGPMRVVGAGHSFSRVADTSGTLISLARMPSVIAIDDGRATVAGGVLYGELAGKLHAAGWGLPNLASLPHLSVAGAVATGTHGSGSLNGCLGTSVSAVEVLTAAGDLITLDRADKDFPGAVVALGALGVITRLTLDLVPAVAFEQFVYEEVPLADELDLGYSVSLFTDWQSPRAGQVWVKHPVTGPRHRPPAVGRPATRQLHPISAMPGVNCTEQLGVPGPWHQRLPHFQLEFTPSSGDELQSEWLLPRDRMVAAIEALLALGPLLRGVLQVSEIRAVAADDLWLSMAYQRASVAFHFTWIRDEGRVLPVIAAVEEALAPFDPRPHWGKLHLAAGRYERLPDFRRLQDRLDPTGRFAAPQPAG